MKLTWSQWSHLLPLDGDEGGSGDKSSCILRSLKLGMGENDRALSDDAGSWAVLGGLDLTNLRFDENYDADVRNNDRLVRLSIRLGTARANVVCILC